MAAGIEVAPHQHVLAVEDPLEEVAAQSRGTLLDLQHDVLVVAPLRLVVRQQGDAREVGQQCAIEVIVPPVRLGELGDALQRSESHRRGHLAILPLVPM